MQFLNIAGAAALTGVGLGSFTAALSCGDVQAF